MTTYSKLTDFASKDALLTGNPAKVVKGVEIDDEFNAITTADASNVKGPITASTDNAIVRWDGTTGRAVQNTGVTISDADVLSTPTLSVTGNTTLGDASTDTVTVNGYMGVGAAPTASIGLYAAPTALTGTSQYGTAVDVTGSSAATATIKSLWTKARTPAVASTFARVDGINITNTVKGAGSTITDQYGLIVDDQTQGTNNYGLTSLVSSGTNKWNIYASGTAANYFAGTTTFNAGVGIGGSAAPTTGQSVEITYGAIAGTGRVMAYDRTGATRMPIVLDGSTASLYTGGTERLRIDSAGNLGLGVTPQAWNPQFRVIEGFGAGSFVTRASNAGTEIWDNAYFSTGGVSTYTTTAAASRLRVAAGQFQAMTAPSGTAGDAVTWSTALAVGLGTTLALEGATSAAGTGIAFPATQLASSNANTLDDYEEGTFTPTIVGTATAGVGTYTTQIGRYTKIGNRVFYTVVLIWTAHTGTGNIRISGLPFATVNTTNVLNTASVVSDSLTFAGQLVAETIVNSTQIGVYQIATGAAVASVGMDTAANIRVSGHYEV